MQTRLPLFALALKSLLNFFYPARCMGCGHELMAEESLLCADCMSQLPFLRLENEADNPMFINIAGRVPVLYATAVFNFTKDGIVQQLLHELKYKGRPDIGRFLGKIAGERLARAGLFTPPDLIVPVPLHRKKLKKRGYNQSLCIAQGIRESFPQAFIREDILLKREETQSQTKKNRLSRWENVKTTFVLNEAAEHDPALQGRHFLLVDDVITTGATIESCVRQLLRIPGSRVSVAAVATPL
ncbi:MAG: double zinc ribbon domain-containing protein [Bacteroides sp.]|nr:double zinc ribbon domain-containing protein [Ruminococcus flavefaciens]MCM1553968.1 double zinc ribbon domain-containing protein [Bacteroides sp.]